MEILDKIIQNVMLAIDRVLSEDDRKTFEDEAKTMCPTGTEQELKDMKIHLMYKNLLKRPAAEIDGLMAKCLNLYHIILF